MALTFDLQNQDEEKVTAADYRGDSLIMFFYPRAMTPGCTVEACDFRDSYDELIEAGYKVVGVSPDKPSANARFREKEGLNFDLLSDVDHELAEELGAWGEKKMYGKTSEGLIRSTFVFDAEGNLVREYRNVRAKGHVARLKEDLLGGAG
ncbi:MAG: thioredoxin-dependent thiol peroxidase [Actinobacteria bacterium]|nr:MAG: thioredoxin-dependent thiol peroxidase [Actinomycetota bacterium]